MAVQEATHLSPVGQRMLPELEAERVDVDDPARQEPVNSVRRRQLPLLVQEAAAVVVAAAVVAVPVVHVAIQEHSA